MEKCLKNFNVLTLCMCHVSRGGERFGGGLGGGLGRGLGGRRLGRRGRMVAQIN